MNIRKKNAFTLIEILVATTIVAILIAIGTVSYTSVSRKSRDSKRRSDVEQIRAALEMYRADNGNYVLGVGGPATTALNVLVSDKYMPAIPVDPKSVEYYYNCESVVNGNCYAYSLQTTLEVTPVTGSICPLTNPYNYCIPNP
jgi:general secretion pathway protein G